MDSTKVMTVIVNATKQGSTIKVGNRHYYAKLTSIKVGGEYKMQIDGNWTYQEFLLQDKAHAHNQLFINSDDCCDYERITITKSINGKFDAQREVREQFRSGNAIGNAIQESSSPNRLIRSSWKMWLSKVF